MGRDSAFAADWLRKANNDLLSAKAVLAVEEAITDVPCFHAQQCVEKSFKGFLTAAGVEYGRTHDLMILLSQLVEIDDSFLDIRDVCAELCEFAVDIRYPGDISEPSRQEAERFASAAAEILRRISERIAIE